MKQKGRLGGKAWFYAQGQRAYHQFYHGGGVQAMAVDAIPLWASRAYMQGFADVKRAENLRKEFGGVYGKRPGR